MMVAKKRRPVMVKTNITVSAEDYELVRQVAQADERSMSYLFRRFIHEGVIARAAELSESGSDLEVFIAQAERKARKRK